MRRSIDEDPREQQTRTGAFLRSIVERLTYCSANQHLHFRDRVRMRGLLVIRAGARDADGGDARIVDTFSEPRLRYPLPYFFDVVLVARDARDSIQEEEVGMAGSRDLLELAPVAILATAVPGKALAVHRDVDAMRQDLHEGERAAKIEEAIGATEGVRNHRPGEHDRLLRDLRRDRSRRLRHRIRAVRDHDPLLRRLPAILHDERAVRVR